ncbi:MAG: hypothetical protein QNK27_10395 [Desulfuromusa sp.]|nr:hypothetical protein [Desulfuromusa sp.]
MSLEKTSVVSSKSPQQSFPIAGPLPAVLARLLQAHDGLRVRFFCKPLTAWGLATYFGLAGNATAVAVLLFAVPTAPSAFILSRQLGGDHVTIASIITVQTGLSFLSLPITLMLLG